MQEPSCRLETSAGVNTGSRLQLREAREHVRHPTCAYVVQPSLASALVITATLPYSATLRA